MLSGPRKCQNKCHKQCVPFQAMPFYVRQCLLFNYEPKTQLALNKAPRWSQIYLPCRRSGIFLKLRRWRRATQQFHLDICEWLRCDTNTKCSKGGPLKALVDFFFSPNLFNCLPDCDSLSIIVLQILVTLIFHVCKLKKKICKRNVDCHCSTIIVY